MSLACTCQALTAAFEGSSRQACFEKAAFQRLLQWKLTGSALHPWHTFHCGHLDEQQTVRLIKWLEDEVITIEVFWEVQARLISKLKGQLPQDAAKVHLQLVLVEKFPHGHVLTAKAKRSLQVYMAQLSAVAKPWYTDVCVVHDPANGEKREQVFDSAPVLVFRHF